AGRPHQIIAGPSTGFASPAAVKLSLMLLSTDRSSKILTMVAMLNVLPRLQLLLLSYQMLPATLLMLSMRWQGQGAAHWLKRFAVHCSVAGRLPLPALNLCPAASRVGYLNMWPASADKLTRI